MKILIVGKGYAGSILSLTLIQHNIDVTIIDRNEPLTASKVAAGIIIPITGRRLAKTHLADKIIPYAFSFYRNIEKSTGVSVFRSKKVLQLFNSTGNLNEWYARSGDADIKSYVDEILPIDRIHQSVKSEFGGIVLNHCGVVDSLKMIDSVKNHPGKNVDVIEQNFHYEEIEILENEIRWKGTLYDSVIFCEGHEAVTNTWFGYLPFKPAKGEILDFHSELLDDTFILNGSVFILPMGNGNFRSGSTYEWQQLDTSPSAEAATTLEKGIESMIQCKYTITDHKAAVRPAIRDRRPVVGFHPVYKRLGIFNGLGTKGALLGPYYANQLVNLIRNGIEPDDDVNLRRYDSLYREH